MASIDSCVLEVDLFDKLTKLVNFFPNQQSLEEATQEIESVLKRLKDKFGIIPQLFCTNSIPQQ